jgi:TolA-binding protein
LRRFRETYPEDDLLQYVLPYLGELTLEAGDAEQAQQVYVDALSRFPAGPLASECQYGVGRALQQQGDVDAAARFFKHLAGDTRQKRADDAQLQLGVMQYNSGRYEEASETLAAFRSAFADSDLKGNALFWQGLSYIALKQWTDAISSLVDAADRVKPELLPEVLFYTAQAKAGAGQLDDATGYYERVLANWPDSPIADDAAVGKLQALYRQQRHAAVKVQAAQFQVQFSRSPLRQQMQRLAGRSLLAMGEYDPAVIVFRRLADSHQQVSDKYLLAVAHLGASQPEAALRALDEIAEENGGKEIADAVYVARASALMSLKRHTAAIEPLTAYLKSRPEGPDAADCRSELVIALAATDRLEAARTAYAEYAAKHASHPALLATTDFLAQAAAAAGETEAARELFGVLAREGNPEPYVAKGLSGLARFGIEADRCGAADESFERLRQLQPDGPLVPQVAMERARKLRETGQHSAALAAYRLIIDEHPTSDRMPLALWEAAAIHVQQKQYREAASLLERLVREHPTFDHLDAVLYRWAWVLIDLERPDDANAVFTRLYLEHPRSVYWADSTYRLAERAAANEDRQRATRLAEQVVAAEPTSEAAAHSLYLLGQLAARAGDWQHVSPPLTRLCEEHPDSDLCHSAGYWLAEAAYRSGRLEDAQRRFDELEQTLGQQDVAWLPMVHLRRAQVLAHQKRWHEAHDRAKEIARRFPDFEKQYEVDYLIARCLGSQARFREAREAYLRVVHSERGRPTETAAMAQWMIGETFFHQKNYNEALRAYSRVELLWDYPQWTAAALLQIGKCHELQGQWREAVARYTELTTKYAETDFAAEGEERLRVARQKAAMAGTSRAKEDL